MKLSLPFYFIFSIIVLRGEPVSAPNDPINIAGIVKVESPEPEKAQVIYCWKIRNSDGIIYYDIPSMRSAMFLKPHIGYSNIKVFWNKVVLLIKETKCNSIYVKKHEGSDPNNEAITLSINEITEFESLALKHGIKVYFWPDYLAESSMLESVFEPAQVSSSSLLITPSTSIIRFNEAFKQFNLK